MCFFKLCPDMYESVLKVDVSQSQVQQSCMKYPLKRLELVPT